MQFNIPAKQALVAKSYSEAKNKVAQGRGLCEKLAEGRKAKAESIMAINEPLQTKGDKP